MKRILWLLIPLLLAGCGQIAQPASTATPTATPTITPSPTVTATPTPTPSPTPTPTPLPAEVLTEAAHAARNGNWVDAEAFYRQVLTYPDSEETRLQAATGLGATLLAADKPQEAIAALSPVLSQTTTLTAAVDLHILLGDAFMQAGQPLTATGHYQAVIQHAPTLARYAHEWLADALFAGGDYTEALQTYQAALATAPTASRQVYLWEKIALSQARLGREAEALAAYDAILAIAKIPAYRARIMNQAAQTAQAFGDTEEAYRRMQQLVAAYPKTDYAYQSLIVLVDAGQPVDDMLRGLVDYYAQAYTPAILAFQRVIGQATQPDGRPYYYLGLSYLDAGNYEEALHTFDTLLTMTGDPYIGSAIYAKARTLAALGRREDAVRTYRSLAEQYPDHPRAPAALWQAAALLEQDDAETAAQAYLQMAEQYPNDDGAPEARFHAGLLRYRHGDVLGAQEAWRDLAAWYPASPRGQAALFWLGKTYLQIGDTLSATEVLSRAANLTPWKFYGLRAADLLAGRQPFASSGSAPAPCSLTDQQQAETWLAGWIGITNTFSSQLPPAIQQDDRWQRGTRLLRLGHYEEGSSELDALRHATDDNALTQYRLSLALRDVGLYRSSIAAAISVWRLSPAEDFRELPRFIGCLIYPLYYRDLVEPEALAEGFDPLVVYALLRQESMFQSGATSFAAAHGLMQVIPSTGQQIAQALGWPPNYQTHDLYRPMVSVRFGVWYLARQRDAIDGNLIAGMAAYNGGPGNAARWWQAAQGDQDLFVELISLDETRTYIERIREHYAHYVWLYRD